MPRKRGPSWIRMGLVFAGIVAAVVITGVAIGALIGGPNGSAVVSTPKPSSAASIATSSPAAAATTPPVDAVAVIPSRPRPVRVAPSAPKTLPEQMAHLVSGSGQMVIATGATLGSNTGTVYMFDLKNGRWVQTLKVPSRFGTNGLTDGVTRHAGGRTTPTGIWQMGAFVWGWHPQPPAGTKMPYRQVTQNTWWSAEHDSTYNTWVQSSSQIQGEHLLDARIQYEFAVDTGYNAPPNQVVLGRGTAIFLHVFDPPTYHNGFTAGCISASREDMIKVFQLLDPAKNPTCAIGTLERGTLTSIYSY